MVLTQPAGSGPYSRLLRLWHSRGLLRHRHTPRTVRDLGRARDSGGWSDVLGLPGLAHRGLLRRRRSACGRSNPGLRGRVEAVHLERVLANDGLLVGDE